MRYRILPRFYYPAQIPPLDLRRTMGMVFLLPLFLLPSSIESELFASRYKNVVVFNEF
jgi:hypothetical protein